MLWCLQSVLHFFDILQQIEYWEAQRVPFLRFWHYETVPKLSFRMKLGFLNSQYILGMYRNSGRISKKFGTNHHWFRPEQNSLKNSIVSKLFHKLIQLTKTISDYGEEIKVFRQFLEEVCFFFLHICFRIRRTAFLNNQMTEVMIQSKKHVT